MSTKSIENAINILRIELKELMNPVNKIYGQINMLNRQRIKFIIKNKEYETDLSKYKDVEITSITAIDQKGEEVYLPTDEGIMVSDGKLELSSYQGGLVIWDNDDNCYVHKYHYSTTKLDILGFIDIKFEKE